MPTIRFKRFTPDNAAAILAEYPGPRSDSTLYGIPLPVGVVFEHCHFVSDPSAAIFVIKPEVKA